MSLVKFRLGKDLRQSAEYEKFMKQLGWTTENHIFIKKTGFITLAKMRRPYEITDWTEIKNVLNKYKVNVCRIDPEIANIAEYKKNGFELSRDQMVATKTLLLDISIPEVKILGEFATETRRKLKKLLSYEVKLDKFDEFYNILRNGYKEIDVWCPPKTEFDALINSFGKKCFCVTIDNKAGCLVIIHKQVAEYYYASATHEGKAENLPYLLAWEAIKEAKKRGAKVWDWNGLYDERFPEKRYLGFSFFKRRFGGTELEFPGGFLGWRLLTNW